MHRLSILLIIFLAYFQYLSAQIVMEKTSFDLGEISLLNEDIIDLSLSNHTDKRLFIIRISTEDHVRVKHTSRTIEPGKSELLRIKLNPQKKGKYQTSMQVYFGQNTNPIELEFAAEVLEIPVNQLQACPDFSATRAVNISPGSYRKQEKGEIKVEQVAVVNKEELRDYLMAKKEEEDAEVFEQDYSETLQEPEIEYNYQNQIENNVEVVESEPEGKLPEITDVDEEQIDIDYNYQSEVAPGEDLANVHEEADREHEDEKPFIEESNEAVDPNLLDDSYRPNNIVFLLDASTSMNKDGKMDLLKSSMKELLITLRPIDKIAIVSYAGEARLLLASTEASDKQKISLIIDSIPADGSTNAVKGLRMALQVAKRNFIEGGNNQIILATDGAFDIGSRNDRLRNKIDNSAKEEIIVSVIGIKNDRWTNKSLKEIADLGKGTLLRIHSEKNLSVILEEVKERSATMDN